MKKKKKFRIQTKVVSLKLFLISLLILTACSSSPEVQRIVEGEELYIQQCATCHQVHGRGYKHVYPPLVQNPIVTLADPQPAIEIVLNGSGGMPSFRDQLDVQELAKIVSYVRYAWGNEAPPVTPAQMK
jgi:mono/diheme cytochrome c family protein